MRESIGLCEGNAPLSESDRGRIIARIHSLLNWCGERIPDRMEVEGKVVSLRDVIFNYITKDDHTEEEKRQAYALADLLMRKEQELEEAIKEKDVGRQKACELCHEARTLLRAVDELRSSPDDKAELSKNHLMKQIEDARRWDKFLKQLK